MVMIAAQITPKKFNEIVHRWQNLFQIKEWVRLKEQKLVLSNDKAYENNFFELGNTIWVLPCLSLT
jgi:hypothetical protein